MTAHRFDLSLRLPAPPALLGWHVALARHLATLGLAPNITYAAVAAPPSWLGLLRMMEQTLYASQSVGERDLLAPAAPPNLPPPEARGAIPLCIDCTSDTPQPFAGRVLRPGLGSGPLIETLLASSLDGVPPLVGWQDGAGRVVASGRAAIIAPHIHTQTVSQALARTISMVGRAVLADAPEPATVTPAAPAGALRVALGAGRALSSRVIATIDKRLQGQKHWNVGWRRDEPGRRIIETPTFDPATFAFLPRDPARYVADPFPVAHQGRHFLFVEEYPYATGKGIISAIAIGPDGPQGAPLPVLERSHHLSYPCIFSHAGELWMLPESAGAGRLELFRCERFPDRWALHAVLLEGQKVADATFFEHAGLCWLAGNTADLGAADQDALSLWFAPHPAGPWTAHPANPVVVDLATTRPAGWVVNVGGVLRRPAQDCTHGYGWGLSLLDIEALSTTTFRQRLFAAHPPPATLGATAFHTLNVGAGIEVIDCVF